MKPNLRVAALLALLAMSFFSGCASIISGRHADVTIDSYPTNAHVVIEDNKGRQVASLQTPGTVSLKRNRAWFLPAKYTATIDAPGYVPVQVPIQSTVNPWVLGNVVIGGIPGLVVDNATGAAWKPKQTEIHRHLCPVDGSQGPMLSTNDAPSPDTPPSPIRMAEHTEPTTQVHGATSFGASTTTK